MHRFRSLSFLAAFLATAAAARPAAASLPADPPPGKTLTGAYGSLLLGTAGPILLGSAMVSQGGETNQIIGGWLIAGGIFLGPSTGQFYAQSYGSGMFSTGLRAGGAALTLAGALASYGSSGNDGGGALLGLLGIGTFLAGSIHSLIDTKAAVDRHQERVSEERFGLSPTLSPADGELRPGALAWMRF